MLALIDIYFVQYTSQTSSSVDLCVGLNNRVICYSTTNSPGFYLAIKSLIVSPLFTLQKLKGNFEGPLLDIAKLL